MHEAFIVPKEPRLCWRMLYPKLSGIRPIFAGESVQVHHLFWARNAIYHGLSALRVKAGENVLVPSYHCRALVDPLIQYGANVKFYDVNLDLSPNFVDITAKIDSKTRAIVAIHYFGFPQAIRRFRDLCNSLNLYLIEDCAHVLNSGSEEGVTLGSSGDVSVFSWRKFLPIYDGGQLRINNRQLSLDVRWDSGGSIFFLKVAKNTLERLLEDSGPAWCLRLLSLSQLRSIFLRGCGAAASTALNVNNYEMDFNLDCVDLRMSSVSKFILEHTDMGSIMASRRRNYQYLVKAIGTDTRVRLMFPELPDQVCPWIFPLWTDQLVDLHVTLRACGIPAATWGGVVHPALPLGQFPSARRLYNNLVFLPIHQSLQLTDLDRMVEILRKCLNETVCVTPKTTDDRIPLSAVSGR